MGQLILFAPVADRLTAEFQREHQELHLMEFFDFFTDVSFWTAPYRLERAEKDWRLTRSTNGSIMLTLFGGISASRG
jgi:hypothetical protein